MAGLQFKAFGDRLIIFLLVACILSNSFGVIAIINNSNSLIAIQKENIVGQAEKTRADVELHANDTRQALNILRQQTQDSEPLLEDVQHHINQTDELAPIVVHNELKLEKLLNATSME